ncbi:antA/AntB antirepressor family protein (plasmid) [Escherichia coli]|nr:antA/AntB antirepressor family protein [Escherichia coli]
MTQEVMIQIFESDFNNDGLVQTVNARDLHEALEIGWDFSTWIERQLGDFKENQDFIIFHKKVEKSKGRPMKDYALTLDTAKHICMMARCEKGRQLRQYFIEVEKQFRLGHTAAPQQQTELIPGTPEHFTKYMTEALTQAYRSYFGEPVQTALVDQQQHTEPVQALPAAPAQAKVEYRKPPRDKLSWAKLQKYINRKDIVMKCFEICGVHSEQFDPGYIVDENGKLIHCDEHTVYDRKQALAVIMAIYELSVPVSKTRREIDGKQFKDKLGNRCFTDISKSAINTAKRMIQAYIMKHGKLI